MGTCERKPYCGHPEEAHSRVKKIDATQVVKRCRECPCTFIAIVVQVQTELPVRERIQAARDEKEAIVARLGMTHASRIETARGIARELAAKNGTVMVWQVQDEFVKRHGLVWRDEEGHTYWAGAIFRGGEWERVGYGESPYNHNVSNTIWKVKA